VLSYASRRPRLLPRPDSLVFVLTAAFLLLAVASPLLFLTINGLRTAPLGPPGEFSFQNWRELFRLPWYWSVLVRSLLVALAAAALAAILSTALAWLIVRTNLGLWPRPVD